MRRLVISPQEWGSQSGYDFLNNDNPAADVENNYHISWSGNELVYERSFRLWEPGRMALSSLGVTDPGPDQPFNVPQLPKGCKIHGVKGHVLVRPGRAAVFYNADTGEFLDPQPDYDDVFAPGLAYGLLTGTDNWSTATAFPAYPPYPPISAPDESEGTNFIDPQQFADFPLYVAAYKGTFNPYGGNFTEGGSIDSGPSDDPDTLLGMDITNPTVIEADRLVWWDMEMCKASHRSREVYVETYVFDGAVKTNFGYKPGTYYSSVKKYPINLDRNWIMSGDQVLWLHFASGIVKTPLFWVEGTTPVPLAYKPAFNIEIVGTMMVSV